jgi:hypothetical protein
MSGWASLLTRSIAAALSRPKELAQLFEAFRDAVIDARTGSQAEDA